MRLKRWESPRREGRNDKGRGGSARKRQLKKQRQMLRQKLKEANKPDDKNNQKGREDKPIFPIFLSNFVQTKGNSLTHSFLLRVYQREVMIFHIPKLPEKFLQLTVVRRRSPSVL
jgi:hypothetical protein